MKKFSKILVLLLAVVTILTAFSVVSLAADEATAPKSYTHNMNGAWEGKAAGTFIGVDVARYGYIYSAVAPNGNYYAIFEPKAGSSNNFVEPSLKVAYNADKTFVYNLEDYPYFVFDFDVMTPTGAHDNPSFNFRLQHTDARSGSSTYVGYPLQITVGAFSNYLDNTPNKWSHVSVVVHTTFDTDAETGKITKTYFNITYFINGVKAKTAPITSTTYNGHLPVDCGHTSIRVNGTSDGDPAVKKTAVDNFAVSYFTDNFGGEGDAKLEAMVAQIYNKDYEMPFGIAVAQVGDNLYDNIDKAIAAAKDGDTVKLLSDIESAVVVDDKAIKIDKNVYNEEGNATGELYEISVTSTTHVPVEKDGILSFEVLQNAQVEVFWDDCPGMADPDINKCLCPEGHNDHLMSAYTEKVMLNTTPVYPGTIPQFEVVNGLVKEFAGWSYTQGGEVEELRPVTTEDCESGFIALYPVYTIVQYDIEVKDPNGKCEYFMADKYYTALSTAKSGSTVTLYNDIETEYGLTIDKILTIDLNGHSLRKWNTSNVEYYYTDAEYTKTSVVSYGTKSSLFHIGASGAYLTIKSSKPGATVYNGTLMVKNFYWSDKNRTELIKETNHGGIMGGAIVGWGSAVGATVEIQGENLSMFGSSIVDADNGAAKDSKVIINGGTYYRTVSDYSALLTNRNGANFEVKNATFYGNNASLIYVWAAKTKQHQDMNFDNCTFVEGDFYTNDSALITFTNCRLESTGFKNGNGDASYGVAKEDVKKFVLGNGCRVNGEIGKLGNAELAEGLSIIPNDYSMTVTRSALTAHKLNSDKTDLDKNATYNAGTKEATYKFSYIVVDPANGLTNVKWVDAEGNLLAETQALKNSTVAPYSGATVPSGDGWRNIVIQEWKNADGNVDYAIGDADEYVFTAVIPTENVTYVSEISDIRFNLSYYANFHKTVYVPYDEDVISTITMVSTTGANVISSKGKVLIDGKEFLALVVYSSTTAVLDDQLVTIGYTIDDVTYTAQYNIGGLIYAGIVLNDSASTEIEKLTVANMVRFVKQSLIEAEVTSNTLYNRIDALIGENGIYDLPDYIANDQYPATEEDYSALSEYIESIHFKVAGSYAAYVFTKTDKAVAEGATVAVSGLGTNCGVRGNTATERTPWTLNLRVYDAINTFTVTVKVPAQVDAETGETIAEAKTISATYSIGSYIKATDSELAKALYAFGAAAKEYRDTRTDY